MTGGISRRTLGAVGISAIVAPLLGAKAAQAQSGEQCRRVATVFVAGDSTAATWPASVIPKAGWGQAISAFLRPRRMVVNNLALSGASSKSFIEAGLLDTIVSEILAEDYLLISFGHNDEKTDERHTDPYTTYQEYLTQYIDVARDHGAHPVLVTPVERRRFDADGHAYESHGEYPEAMRQLGQTTGVPVVDLTAMSLALWESLGVEGTKDCFLWLDAGENENFPNGSSDNTHFQAHGAIEVARLVVADMVQQRVVAKDNVMRLRDSVPDDVLTWPETI